MSGYKAQIIIITFLINQIFCDLLKEGNEDTKIRNKIDSSTKLLYEKYPRTIYDFPIIQQLQPSFPLQGQDSSMTAPLVLSLGFGNFRGFKEIVLPTDFPKETPLRGSSLFFRHPAQFQNQDGGYRPGPLHFPPYYNFESGGNKELLSWMKPIYSKGVDLGALDNVRFPIQFLVPQIPEIQYTGPVLSSEMKDPNSGMLESSPHMDTPKPLGHMMPPGKTIYYPTTYAKDYFIDTTKPQSYATQSLLLGELRDDRGSQEEKQEEPTVSIYDMENPAENYGASYGVSSASEYYHSNMKPITFEHGSRKPKNIYEIISAGKVAPREMDMTVNIGGQRRLNGNWKPITADGNWAESSDAVAVKSIEHENGLVEGDETNEGSTDKPAQQDLEILLTGEEVTKKDDGKGKSSSKERIENVGESNADMLTGETIAESDEPKTATQLTVLSEVLSVSKSEATTI